MNKPDFDSIAKDIANNLVVGELAAKAEGLVDVGIVGVVNEVDVESIRDALENAFNAGLAQKIATTTRFHQAMCDALVEREELLWKIACDVRCFGTHDTCAGEDGKDECDCGYQGASDELDEYERAYKMPEMPKEID